MAHEKRQFGRAAIAVQQVDLKAGGDHDARTQLGEMPRAVARVVGDGAGQAGCRSVTAHARSAASPWALSPIVRSLMALVPMGYIRPRRPPVPKGIMVQKTSSSCLPLLVGDVLDHGRGVARHSAVRSTTAGCWSHGPARQPLWRLAAASRFGQSLSRRHHPSGSPSCARSQLRWQCDSHA